MYLTNFLRNCMWHNITTSTEMIFGTLYSILTFTAHISTLKFKFNLNELKYEIKLGRGT